MRVCGIDPGPKTSGVVIWDSEKGLVIWAGVFTNQETLFLLKAKADSYDCVGIERIRGYGVVAGDDTFDTCEWIGRFEISAPKGVTLIPRKDIKRHLCGNTTTNDKYVRQALIDHYGEVGTAKSPGPLYGVAGSQNHKWAALAVAVTLADYIKEGKNGGKKEERIKDGRGTKATSRG